MTEYWVVIEDNDGFMIEDLILAADDEDARMTAQELLSEFNGVEVIEVIKTSEAGL